jgi:vancomycin resistance protein YoaR
MSAHPPYPPSRPPTTSFGAWLVRLGLLSVTGFVLLVLVLMIFYAGFLLRHQDRIYPGVTAMGVDLSGMTMSEATVALAGQFEYGAGGVYTLRDGDTIWQVTASDLGVAFNLDETVAQAYAIGHERDIVFNVVEQAGAWFSGQDVAPVITYNQGVALDFLNTIASDINRPAQDASLSINGTQVTTSEGQIGRQMDVGATLRAIDSAILSQASSAEIPLVINETPPQVWSVEAPAERIRTALSAPVQLTANDETGQTLGTWTASVDQIASLLNVTLINNGDGTRSYDVSVNTSAFETYVNSLAQGLIASPRDGRFRFNPATAQLEVIQPATSGRTLNVEATLAQLEAGIFDAVNRTIPVVFDSQLARYHNQISAAELGITQLVSESTTYFMGSSANRRTNIAVSASKFDGVIIAPGEEFSFNTLLGDISLENGFVEGKVIFGGRTTSGIGGGVCQVSTTVFRAAFNGGFAITERNSHGYRVGYYELNNSDPGLDAAIWQPERDFKFQNNTPYHLLIETSFFPNESALQFRFYSTPYWRAEIEPAIVKNLVPALPTQYEANAELQPGQSLQVDYSAEGADVTVYRNIYNMQGEMVREDYIYTHYLPWAAIFQVAPGDSRLNQS